MSPDRRGVGCDQDAPEKRTIAKKKKKEKVAWKGFEEKEAAKKEVAKKKLAKKKRAATGNKTSPSVACVRNLGNSPRVPAGARVGADQHVGKSLPHWRDERRSRPTTGLPVHSKIPYAANGSVADGVLRGLVVDLATLGSRGFPQVYSVIRDTEETAE